MYYAAYFTHLVFGWLSTKILPPLDLKVPLKPLKLQSRNLQGKFQEITENCAIPPSSHLNIYNIKCLTSGITSINN